MSSDQVEWCAMLQDLCELLSDLNRPLMDDGFVERADDGQRGQKYVFGSPTNTFQSFYFILVSAGLG